MSDGCNRQMVNNDTIVTYPYLKKLGNCQKVTWQFTLLNAYFWKSAKAFWAMFQWAMIPLILSVSSLDSVARKMTLH